MESLSDCVRRKGRGETMATGVGIGGSVTTSSGYSRLGDVASFVDSLAKTAAQTFERVQTVRTGGTVVTAPAPVAAPSNGNGNGGLSPETWRTVLLAGAVIAIGAAIWLAVKKK